MTARRLTPGRIALRAGALTVIALALGGPTPGYVGNCSTDGGGAGTVDRRQFCTDEETYKCARDLAAGRLDMPGYNACVAPIDARCNGFNFPAGCAPTQELAAACISALSDASRISTLFPDIVECQSNTLCGAAAPLTSGDGI